MTNLNGNVSSTEQFSWEKLELEVKNNPHITKNTPATKIMVILKDASLFWTQYGRVVQSHLPSTHAYLPYLIGQVKEKPKQHQEVLTSIERMVTEIIRSQFLHGISSIYRTEKTIEQPEILDPFANPVEALLEGQGIIINDYIKPAYLEGKLLVNTEEKPGKRQLILTAGQQSIAELNFGPHFSSKISAIFIRNIKDDNTTNLAVIYNGSRAYFVDISGNESAAIDVSSHHFQYYNSNFKRYVEPCLAELARIFGGHYTSTIELKKVRIDSLELPQLRMIQRIEIVWKQHFCQIAPANIVENKNSSTALYELYKAPDQLYCDFTILFSGGQLQVHASQLYIRGDEILQTRMKSGLVKYLNLSYFSESTVKAFVDYIYLGPEAFCEQILAVEDENAIDIIEIFELAHTYRIKNLIDCCSNLIAVTATQADIPEIIKLVKKYSEIDGKCNDHLNTLLENLLGVARIQEMLATEVLQESEVVEPVVEEVPGGIAEVAAPIAAVVELVFEEIHEEEVQVQQEESSGCVIL